MTEMGLQILLELITTVVIFSTEEIGPVLKGWK